MSKNKFYAAFGEFEIPCNIGDQTCGWIPPERLVRFKADKILGNVAMMKSGDKTLVLASMDILFIDKEDSDIFRNMVANALNIDYDSVTIAATHNHSGPATTSILGSTKSPELLKMIGERLVSTCLELQQKLQPAVMCCGFTYENDITWNRRYILKNGTVWSHPQLDKMDVLCAEGSIDPQVGVVCVRNMEGLAMGYLVNFACHPLFYGGQCIASASFPGQLRKELKNLENQECVTLFLNGAAGDISHVNPFDAKRTTAESVGKQLAKRSYEVAFTSQYTSEVELNSLSDVVIVPKRYIDDEHIERAKQVVNGNNEIEIDPAWHPVSTVSKKEFAEQLIRLREDSINNPTITLPLQVMRIGESIWTFSPGELFSRFGMEIKINSKARNTFVVSYANGGEGYIFTPEAEKRGGYEATPCGGSLFDSQAGGLIVEKISNMLELL